MVQAAFPRKAWERGAGISHLAPAVNVSSHFTPYLPASPSGPIPTRMLNRKFEKAISSSMFPGQ